MADRKSFLLRIDPALWADLEAWAADELRSVNGQIEYLLKQAVARRTGMASKGELAARRGKAAGEPPPA
ncbi:MAG TPA: Arc family DNA-binding protein [Verrucomicrobiae bacterium]